MNNNNTKERNFFLSPLNPIFPSQYYPLATVSWAFKDAHKLCGFWFWLLSRAPIHCHTWILLLKSEHKNSPACKESVWVLSLNTIHPSVMSFFFFFKPKKVRNIHNVSWFRASAAEAHPLDEYTCVFLLGWILALQSHRSPSQQLSPLKKWINLSSVVFHLARVTLAVLPLHQAPVANTKFNNEKKERKKRKRKSHNFANNEM